VRFLQGEVAPRLKTFTGADVALAGHFVELGIWAACLAVSAPAETYDWEIKQRLDEWAAEQGGANVVGLAVGEKQRFRGVTIISWDTSPPSTLGMAGLDGILVSGSARRLG
jgi:hypothetical protein